MFQRARRFCLTSFIEQTIGKAPPEAYQVIFGNRQNRLSKPITKMTLGEMIDAQKNWSSKTWVKANWGFGTAHPRHGAGNRHVRGELGEDHGLDAGLIIASKIGNQRRGESPAIGEHHNRE